MHLRALLLVLIVVKLVFISLDTTIRFYLGDSAAYLYGAMDQGQLPDDRSFTYSLVLRALARPFESLTAVLIWQSLAGVAVAALLWWALVRVMGVRSRMAVVAACLLAMEPAQLYYERMVLAETFGLLWFAGFYGAAAAYLVFTRREASDAGAMGAAWRWLPLVAVLGLLAATFRLNYLPVVLVISVTLPLIRVLGGWRPRWRIVAAHLAVALCAVGVAHVAYRGWVSAIFSAPPGYVGRAGVMQLGLIVPLVRPEHLERVGLPRDFGQQLKYPLDDPDARMAHMWRPGGLVRELATRGLPVDAIGRELSRMAIADDPLGLVRIGVATVGNYFTPDGITHALDNDLGRREIPADVLWGLRTYWNYEAGDVPRRVTPVLTYFAWGTWWLVACLFLLVPLSIANVAVHWRTPLRHQALLAGLFGIGLVLAHVLFVNVALYRYMHPLPFFLLLNLVPVLQHVASRHALRRVPARSAGAQWREGGSPRASRSGPPNVAARA